MGEFKFANYSKPVSEVYDYACNLDNIDNDGYDIHSTFEIYEDSNGKYFCNIEFDSITFETLKIFDFNNAISRIIEGLEYEVATNEAGNAQRKNFREVIAKIEKDKIKDQII